MGSAAASLGSGLLQGGGSMLGGEAASKGAERAAGHQKEAARVATQAQLEMYYQGRDDLASWRETGANALQALYGKRTYGMPEPVREDFGTQEEFDKAYQDYESSATYQGGLIQQGPGEFVPEDQPGYQFGFENFIKKPYMSSAAAGGKRLSGQTLKDLSGYASDYGSTQYDNFMNRYYNSLVPYSNLASAGQASAAGSAQLGVQTGQQVGQNILAGGAAQAAGAVGQANAYNQGMAGVVGAGQNALQSYMDYKILQKTGAGTNAFNAAGATGSGASSGFWNGGASADPYGAEWKGGAY